MKSVITHSETASRKAACWHAYLINLDSADIRLRFMHQQLHQAGIAFTRVSAIDGSKLTLPLPEVSAWSYKFFHGRYLSESEVGCYLSHIKAIDQFLASDFDFGLILEDDALLSIGVRSIIDSAIEYGLEDWDILRLSTVNTGKRFVVMRLQGFGLGVCLTREKGAAGYVLNRKAAARLRKYLLPMRLAYDIAFDLEYLVGLKALGVEPLPINQQMGFPTQIQHSVRKLPPWRYLTVFPFRAAIEIDRVICRAALFLRLRGKYVLKHDQRS